MRYPQDIQENYPRCTQDITDKYLRYSKYLLILCLEYTCNISEIYPKYTQNIYMGDMRGMYPRYT